MRKELFINGVGVMAIIDNKFYIVDKEWECYKGCSKNEFIEELKKMSWICLTSWDKDLRETYLNLVNYTKGME